MNFILIIILVLIHYVHNQTCKEMKKMHMVEQVINEWLKVRIRYLGNPTEFVKKSKEQMFEDTEFLGDICEDYKETSILEFLKYSDSPPPLSEYKPVITKDDAFFVKKGKNE